MVSCDFVCLQLYLGVCVSWATPVPSAFSRNSTHMPPLHSPSAASLALRFSAVKMPLMPWAMASDSALTCACMYVYS